MYSTVLTVNVTLNCSKVVPFPLYEIFPAFSLKLNLLSQCVNLLKNPGKFLQRIERNLTNVNSVHFI